MYDEVRGDGFEPRRQKEFLPQNGPTMTGVSRKIESMSTEVNRLLLKMYVEIDMPGDGNTQPGILVTR